MGNEPVLPAERHDAQRDVDEPRQPALELRNDAEFRKLLEDLRDAPLAEAHAGRSLPGIMFRERPLGATRVRSPDLYREGVSCPRTARARSRPRRPRCG